MDNDAFRATYHAVNAHFCPYEKGILTHGCACSLASRFCIAEREGVQCASATARATCLELLGLLRQQARFALKTSAETPLPHAKAMRIQIGGLRGIQAALTPDAPVPDVIQDVHATIAAAIARFGALDQLPFPRIMQQIAAYRGRRRGRSRGR